MIKTNKRTKNNSRFIMLFVIGLSWSGSTQAQKSTNAAGGDAVGSGGTVAYSIGQVGYTNNSDASGTVSQGVQQAYEIFTLGIEETEINISLSVFPNPTADVLTLHINDYNNDKLSCLLYNLQGELLITVQITGQETKIDAASLASATYIINILNQENKQVQLYKLIKTK